MTDIRMAGDRHETMVGDSHETILVTEEIRTDTVMMADQDMTGIIRIPT